MIGYERAVGRIIRVQQTITHAIVHPSTGICHLLSTRETSAPRKLKVLVVVLCSCSCMCVVPVQVHISVGVPKSRRICRVALILSHRWTAARCSTTSNMARDLCCFLLVPK